MSTRQERRRAKILCTLGPASSSPEMVGKLIDAGMNAARLNFSHGTYAEHRAVYETVRTEARRRNVAVAILADLQGPKLRIGEIPAPGFTLAEDDTLILSTDPAARVEQVGNVARVTTSYRHLATEAQPKNIILLDDGSIEVVVQHVTGFDVHTRVVQGGVLTSNKGMNLPGMALGIEALTAKDEQDLRFALDLGVDLVALSFVRRREDITRVKNLMAEHGRICPVVAKIEKPEAVENLAEIVYVADGLMVARGDLGVETGPEEVPMIQKRVIEMANAHGKLVITATQMLDSMIRNPRPTRAEATDVANAVLDGTDALMLSGETAVGAHPIRTVQTMGRIIEYTERAPRYWRDAPQNLELNNTTNAIAQSAVTCSKSLPLTKAIVTYTGSGGIARLVSEYRPKVPIFALTPKPETYQALALYWGVIPVLFEASMEDDRQVFAKIDRTLIDGGYLDPGDRVVIAFGYPLFAQRPVNLLKLHTIGESLTSNGAPSSS